MEKQIKEYLKNTKFSLKDYAKTNLLHKNYKNDDFLLLLKNNKENIESYFEYLYDDIVINTLEQNVYIKQNLTTIKGISQIKPLINQNTTQLNREFLVKIMDENSNDNNIKEFTIKFYLAYYKKINGIMKKALKRIIE